MKITLPIITLPICVFVMHQLHTYLHFLSIITLILYFAIQNTIIGTCISDRSVWMKLAAWWQLHNRIACKWQTADIWGNDKHTCVDLHISKLQVCININRPEITAKSDIWREIKKTKNKTKQNKTKTQTPLNMSLHRAKLRGFYRFCWQSIFVDRMLTKN